MKLCLRCNQYFEDGIELCPIDSSQLEAVGDHPLIGALINDRYVVDSVIGKGSTGIVYRATRLLMGTEVAVKVLHSYLGAEPGALDRFLREARAASRLRHPHIINIWEFGATDDGQPYFVMDYLEGMTLADLIKQKGFLHPMKVLPIINQICEALNEAHRQNIIHRDIKPENIVLQETDYAQGQDFVKVLDFGIADQPTKDSGKQRSKMAAGSPAYMSPEQCQGFELDSRTDIYSLGVIVFEMLTGQRPFTADDVMNLFYQHVSKAPPRLSSVLEEQKFSPQIEAVVSKALAKKPAQRYQTVKEFQKDFDDACRGTEPGKGRKNEGLGLDMYSVPLGEMLTDTGSNKRLGGFMPGQEEMLFDSEGVMDDSRLASGANKPSRPPAESAELGQKPAAAPAQQDYQEAVNRLLKSAKRASEAPAAPAASQPAGDVSNWARDVLHHDDENSEEPDRTKPIPPSTPRETFKSTTRSSGSHFPHHAYEAPKSDNAKAARSPEAPDVTNWAQRVLSRAGDGGNSSTTLTPTPSPDKPAQAPTAPTQDKSGETPAAKPPAPGKPGAPSKDGALTASGSPAAWTPPPTPPEVTPNVVPTNPPPPDAPKRDPNAPKDALSALGLTPQGMPEQKKPPAPPALHSVSSTPPAGTFGTNWPDATPSTPMRPADFLRNKAKHASDLKTAPEPPVPTAASKLPTTDSLADALKVSALEPDSNSAKPKDSDLSGVAPPTSAEDLDALTSAPLPVFNAKSPTQPTARPPIKPPSESTTEVQDSGIRPAAAPERVTDGSAAEPAPALTKPPEPTGAKPPVIPGKPLEERPLGVQLQPPEPQAKPAAAPINLGNEPPESSPAMAQFSGADIKPPASPAKPQEDAAGKPPPPPKLPAEPATEAGRTQSQVDTGPMQQPQKLHGISESMESLLAQLGSETPPSVMKHPQKTDSQIDLPPVKPADEPAPKLAAKPGGGFAHAAERLLGAFKGGDKDKQKPAAEPATPAPITPFAPAAADASAKKEPPFAAEPAVKPPEPAAMSEPQPFESAGKLPQLAAKPPEPEIKTPAPEEKAPAPADAKAAPAEPAAAPNVVPPTPPAASGPSRFAAAAGGKAIPGPTRFGAPPSRFGGPKEPPLEQPAASTNVEPPQAAPVIPAVPAQLPPVPSSSPVDSAHSEDDEKRRRFEEPVNKGNESLSSFANAVGALIDSAILPKKGDRLTESSASPVYNRGSEGGGPLKLPDPSRSDAKIQSAKLPDAVTAKTPVPPLPPKAPPPSPVPPPTSVTPPAAKTTFDPKRFEEPINKGSLGETRFDEDVNRALRPVSEHRLPAMEQPAAAPQAAKPEPPKPDPPKIEIPKPEIPKPEIPKLEIPRREITKLEIPKIEIPKPEIPKPEIPKFEIPKPEPPKPAVTPPAAPGAGSLLGSLEARLAAAAGRTPPGAPKPDAPLAPKSFPPPTAPTPEEKEPATPGPAAFKPSTAEKPVVDEDMMQTLAKLAGGVSSSTDEAQEKELEQAKSAEPAAPEPAAPEPAKTPEKVEVETVAEGKDALPSASAAEEIIDVTPEPAEKEKGISQPPKPSFDPKRFDEPVNKGSEKLNSLAQAVDGAMEAVMKKPGQGGEPAHSQQETGMIDSAALKAKVASIKSKLGQQPATAEVPVPPPPQGTPPVPPPAAAADDKMTDAVSRLIEAAQKVPDQTTASTASAKPEALNRKIEAVKKKIEALKSGTAPVGGPGTAPAAPAPAPLAPPSPAPPRAVPSGGPLTDAGNVNDAVNRLLEAAQSGVYPTVPRKELSGKNQAVPAPQSSTPAGGTRLPDTRRHAEPATPAQSVPAFDAANRAQELMNQAKTRANAEAATDYYGGYKPMDKVDRNAVAEQRKKDRARLRGKQPEGGGLIVKGLIAVILMGAAYWFYDHSHAPQKPPVTAASSIDDLIKNKSWDEAKTFLEDKKEKDGKLSVKDTQNYYDAVYYLAKQQEVEGDYKKALETINILPSAASSKKRPLTKLKREIKKELAKAPK